MEGVREKRKDSESPVYVGPETKPDKGKGRIKTLPLRYSVNQGIFVLREITDRPVIIQGKFNPEILISSANPDNGGNYRS